MQSKFVALPEGENKTLQVEAIPLRVENAFFYSGAINSSPGKFNQQKEEMK